MHFEAAEGMAFHLQIRFLLGDFFRSQVFARFVSIPFGLSLACTRIEDAECAEEAERAPCTKLS